MPFQFKSSENGGLRPAADIHSSPLLKFEMNTIAAVVVFSVLLSQPLSLSAQVESSVSPKTWSPESGTLPDAVQASFDSARLKSTFAIPRFKRLSYSYKNELMIPGTPKQKNPTQSRHDISAQGELLSDTFTPMPNFEMKSTSIFGGLVRVAEPAEGRPCSGSFISKLQVEIPPVLQVGSKIRMQYALTPNPGTECTPTRPIDEQCEATSQIDAKTMYATLTGRAIKLQCWTSNRLNPGTTTYKVYLEDLGLVMSSTEREHRGQMMRTFTSFIVE